MFHVIFTHNETVVGVLVALILTITIAILFRKISEEAEPPRGAQLDVQALETTLKKVLGAAPAEALARVGAPGGIVDEEDKAGGNVQLAVAEREKKIAELTTALDAAKAQAGSSDGKDAMAMLELQNKIRELEARLAEYAIIEDDIADLSLYKEENQRLKTEIEQLKSATGAVAGSTIVKGAAPEPAAVKVVTGGDDDDVMKEFAAAVSENAPPKAAAATSIELAPAQVGSTLVADSPKDEIAAMLGAVDSIEGMPAPAAASQTDVDEMLNAAKSDGEGEDDPLGGALDTGKMMEEVASLGEADDGNDDALDGALDTDKLLSEVNALNPGAAAVSKAASPAAVPQTDALVAEMHGADMPPAEDLFGEFKDEEKEK